MKANYNLVKRMNPSTKELLWYASPSGKGVMDAAETAKIAVGNTTLSKGEFNHVMETVVDNLVPQIMSGITVTLGNLGKLRLSFSSKGVTNIDDFDPQTMIQNVKFIFAPSVELKQALQTATFELDGVVEDGVKYGSKDSYRTVKNVVIPPAVTTILDMKTQKTDGTLTRDQLGKFMGNGLLLVGADGTSPGQIDFYGENNPELSVETVTIFGYNSDTEVVFIVPRDLAEGKYHVTLTTYYSGTDTPLEEPRVIEIPEVTLV